MNDVIRICIFILFNAIFASLCTAVAPDQAVLDAEMQRIKTIEQAEPAVVSIFESQGRGGGSGVLISADGYALTNFHVVKPCGVAMKCGLSDGRIYDAVLVGLDPTGDVALIKLLERDDFPIAKMAANSNFVKPGDNVLAMGNPFLLSTNLRPTVTYGIISGVHRYQFPSGTLLEYTDCLQTDASINPGNSGGPLFNDSGELIGINGRCSFDKRGRVSVGVGYAISINQIKNFLADLKSGRIVDHATLGARIMTDEEGRVVVAEILEQSDAYRRGLRDGDELISFADRAITTANGFKNVLGILPKGWRVPLSYRRDGTQYDIMVRLQGLHHQEELLQAAEKLQPDEPLPIPKPDEEQKPMTPGQEKPDNLKKPEPGGRRPAFMAQQNEEIPEIVKKYLQPKRGYANYYFNKFNQDEIWKAWNANFNLYDKRGSWSLSGNLPNGGTFVFNVGQNTAELRGPSFQSKWTASDDLSSSLEPAGSGGLLTAVFLWRRLAVEGFSRFGEVYYVGSAPLHGREGLTEVIAGSYKGVECRFYFDPAEGHLLAMEMFPEEDADPCDVYYSQYHKVEGCSVPGRIEVRHGDEIFAAFTINLFKFEKDDK